MTTEQAIEMLMHFENISEGMIITNSFLAVVVGFFFAFALLAFTFMRR